MKLKVLRNIKHNGIYYEAGKVYDFDESDTSLEQLKTETHTNIFVPLREGETLREEEVKIVEEAPKEAAAEPTPAPAEKTPKINQSGAPVAPPAPNV